MRPLSAAALISGLISLGSTSKLIRDGNSNWPTRQYHRSWGFCSVCHLQNISRLGLEDRLHLLERERKRSGGGGSKREGEKEGSESLGVSVHDEEKGGRVRKRKREREDERGKE